MEMEHNTSLKVTEYRFALQIDKLTICGMHIYIKVCYVTLNSYNSVAIQPVGSVIFTALKYVVLGSFLQGKIKGRKI